MPAVEMAWGDQRRRTGSGGALEGLRDDALYKYTFTLLYFTLLYKRDVMMMMMMMMAMLMIMITTL